VTSFDPLISAALDAQVPLRTDRTPDWEGVLARANRPGGRRRRTPALVAIAAALVIVASALAATGHDPIGSLSSWLDGKPGEPASRAEQASFAAHNAASFAKFPGGTQLRRLDQASTAGKTFVLLGFKSGQSLCLELTPARRPARQPATQCVTLRELDSSTAPALVASERLLEVGEHTALADSIVGFADDSVKAIEFRTAHGPWQTAPVTNNVFVGFAHERFKRPRGPAEPVSQIEQIRALTTNGATVAIPFVAGYVTYPSGPPKAPSYVAVSTPKAAGLPGPAQATTRFGGGTISWLADRRGRGSAWEPTTGRFLSKRSILFSRAVQPDPGNPFELGIFLRTANGVLSPRQRTKYTAMLCQTEIFPLLPSSGWDCHPALNATHLFPAGAPFELGGIMAGGQQMTNLAGLAADQVASMKLFLSTGRVIPVALRDNAFSVGAPAIQFPAKLVAYGARGDVLGLRVIAGPAHPIACPTPAIWQPSKLPAPKTYQRLDLANLSVDGKRILGLTPAGVTAALGKPDRAAGFKHLGFGQPAYFYGGTLPSGALLRVQFQRTKHGTRVVGLDFQGRGLVDASLGRLLNATPLTLQHELVATGHFRLALPYASASTALGSPLGGCTGAVTGPNGTEITFGVDPYEHARPYLDVDRNQ